MTSMYMLSALRRRKDPGNEYLTSKCHKTLIRKDNVLAYEYAYDRIKRLCDTGTWRIYRSVNKRDLIKGMKMLQVELINRGEEIAYKIDQVWKSILMKPECKAERKFLIDIDTRDIPPQYIKAKYLKDVKIHESNKTPNGYHMVTDPFDSRGILSDLGESIEIKRDALLYMNTISRQNCE